jgi:hypothetical protein
MPGAMTRLLALVVLAPLAVALSAVPGCSDACEDLAPICDRCTDVSLQESCERTVLDDVQEICSGRESVFATECPEVVTTASTGTGVATVGPTSSSAGGAAAGGAATGGAAAGGAATGGAGGSGGAGG